MPFLFIRPKQVTSDCAGRFSQHCYQGQFCSLSSVLYVRLSLFSKTQKALSFNLSGLFDSLQIQKCLKAVNGSAVHVVPSNPLNF